MTIGRMLELAMFVIVNNVPYFAGLILYPFRDKYRFSNRMTYALTAFIMFLTILKEFVVQTYSIPPHLSTLFTMVVAFVMIFGLLKARPGKTFMMLLLVMNISILPLYLGKYTEGLFFYENSLQTFRWSHTLFMSLWQIPLFYGLIKYMNSIVIPVMAKSHGDRIWSYLWTIPMTFFLIWTLYLAQFPYYATASLAERTQSMAMILIVSAGSLVIYHITFKLLNEMLKNETYTAQYNHLKSNIDEARKARHDVRHHLVMVDTYLKDGKYDEVRKYLEEYKLSLPMEEALTFCDHYGINAVLTYTKQQANMLEVPCSIHVKYPESIPVSDQDLTIVIGNLLENALDACKRDLEENPEFQAFIDIKGEYDNGIFLLSIKNTSMHQAQKNVEHFYISSKRSNGQSGIGISSVESIVKKYHGEFTIEQSDGLFKAGVMINTLM